MMMVSLFGKDIDKLTYEELKRERSVQRYLQRKLKSWLSAERYNNEKYAITEEERIEARQKIQEAYENGEITYHQWLGKLSVVERHATNQRYDKVVFLENYVKNIDLFIKDLNYYIDHRTEPITRASRNRSKLQIRNRNAKMRKSVINENAKAYQWKESIERDGFFVSWDKEKFLLIASDRGYQTDSAIIQAVSEELRLDRTKARLIIDNGRFTWGQVLCLGGLLEMTPKEFCDTFLVGYFVEQFGEYRANCDNLSKDMLLASAIKPQKESD